MTVDLSDISHSSGGPFSDIDRRRCRPSSNKTRIMVKKHVHFSSSIADDGPLTVRFLEFVNTEFCSQDVQVRKQIWYSSLEIRGIKQANMDACDINNSKNEDEVDDNAVCWRGLEHFVEGETKRRQRIQQFVCAILKLQTDRLRKGSKPEAISDVLQSFARSQSRGDRRRAQKVGKLDSAEAQLWNDEPQLEDDSKNDNSGKSKSFLLRGAASSRRILGLHARRRRISSMLPPSQQQPLQQEPRQRSSLPAIRRNLSGDHDSFEKRRTLLRRMSLRAAALFPNNNSSNNSSSRPQTPSDLFLNASTHSLESTGSTA